ncbi:hypothetical protein U7230_10355 [Carboxydochorda subterranea]|uniref:Uncharacterized protein n=1 Tax=Carboxydichorda subterranea TaxID=3109565 RepID=A0ABZ1BUK8_9FIRM|nr:hypothetical protein [Limnochorda sp. L945t]WRP16495.1 hypothetical protein U7230_10355 [Limnochorda sp. L945t]
MPLIPAPDPIGIPAPPALLQFLLVFTYILHSLFVGVVVGGSALALAGVSGSLRETGVGRVLGGHLAQALPVAMAFAITIGVAPLLFVQLLFGQFFYTGSVFMGWAWFSVIPVLIVGYYGLYAWALGQRDGVNRTAGLVVALAAFAWVAFVMVNNMSLYAHPERFPALFNLSGTALNTGEPTLLPRYLHALLNFLVIGASYALAAGHVLTGTNAQAGQTLRRMGLRWLIGSAVLQIPVSLWYYVALPVTLRHGTLQDLGAAVALLSGAVMLVAWLAAERARSRGLLAVVASLFTVTMAVGLAIARHGVRMASLQPAISPEAWKLAPQWPQFILFALLLVAGLVFVGYLLWRYPWRSGLDDTRGLA